MIVASGAGNGQSHGGLGEGIDLVVGEGDLFLVGIGHSEAVRDHTEVPGADGGFIEAEIIVDAGRFEEVAGEVFEEELVVGDVGVEGADDVVTILRSIGNGGIPFAAVGLGVAEPVEPVASPAFAEAAGGEEVIDDFEVSLLGRILSVGGDEVG